MLIFLKIFDGWDGILWWGILILFGIEIFGDYGSVGMLIIGI